MNTLKSNVVFLLLAVAVSILSCKEDDTKPKGQFETGVFVVNEGGFQHSDGTIAHINKSTNQVTQDLFGTMNAGKALGDVVQSMAIDGDRAYVVVNNSNKVEVVNANTFESIATITDLSLPRYFTVYNGKGYVTEWVSFSSPGRVSVIDLQSYTVTENITAGSGADNIIAANNKLFISNNFTNTVTVINPATSTTIQTLEVGDTPGNFLLDSQNKVWVICSGGFGKNNGKLVQIDPASNAVIKTIELNARVSSQAAINRDRNKIYYLKERSIWSINLQDVQSGPALILTEPTAVSLYSLGFDPNAEIFYLGDSKGFAGNGTVFRYSVNGTAVDKLEVGIGPNGFVFK